MKSLLKMALEDETLTFDPELVDSDREEDSQFAAEEERIDRWLKQLKERRTAVESLNTYQVVIEGLIKSGSCTKETANVICAEALSVVTKAGGKISMPSLEADDPSSIQRYHEKALEGIGDHVARFFDDFFQSFVVSFKHFIDIPNDWMLSVNRRISEYERRLQETEAEFYSKRRHFRAGDHHLSLLELWYFFSMKNGPSTNIPGDLKYDTEASKFILDTFPSRIIEQLENSVKALRAGDMTSVDKAKKMLDSFSKFKNTEDLFDSKFIGDQNLFNVVSVVRSPGSIKKPVEFGGKSWTTISDLATRVAIEEKKSIKHSMMKGGAQVIGLIQSIKLADIPPAVLSTDEIGDVINYGKSYIANAKAFLEHEKKFNSVVNDIIKEAERKGNHSQSVNMTDDELKAFHKLLNQVLDYIENTIMSMKSPCRDELQRSIRGAKYCSYLGKRMIWNAKPYFG